jgi:flagellar motility protein MotE (MotC chaperone)
MTKLLTSTWTTLPVSVVIYLVATLAFWKTPAPAPRANHASPAVAQGGFGQYQSPEADQLVAELKEEKKKLDDREQQLDELGSRLDTERGEISNATLSVQQLQSEFDKNVLRVKEEETANLKKLAKVYSSMAPDSAAIILADLDDDSVAKILIFMKEADTAAVLESLSKKSDADAKRAATLSERLRVAAFRSSAAQ